MSHALFGTDVRRLRWRELQRFTSCGATTLTWLLLRSGVVRPKVSFDQLVGVQWAETETSWDRIPPVFRGELAPPLHSLAGCGYLPAAAHWLPNPHAGSDGAAAYLLHPSGTSYAFVGHTMNQRAGMALTATAIVTALVDGTTLATTDLRQHLDDSFATVHYVGAVTSAQLAHVHAAALPAYAGRIKPLTDVAALARFVDTMEARSYAERVARGVYVPMPQPTAIDTRLDRLSR